MDHDKRSGVPLTGVPETLLWNLYQRAVAAQQPRSVLSDPTAVELVDRLDYPFAETFGAPNPFLAQGQALRVRSFDAVVREFLTEHPAGTVVALGEGLETQFWRVDNGRMRWIGVDLPETVSVRRRFLPDGPRRSTLACPVQDPSWIMEVDTTSGVLVTAQGLLMYLRPTEVRDLIAACAAHFTGGSLVFDAVPRWFSTLTLRGRMKTAQGYTAPPMPWAMDAGELPKVFGAHPNIIEVREVPLPRGHGMYYGAVHPVVRRVPGIRNIRPTMTVLARFAGP